MSNSFQLSGEIALVTGGGSGIGKAIATAFIKAGATVVITGRNQEKLNKTQQELGSKAVTYVHDITDFSTSKPLVDAIEKKVGAITILVNNAGNHLKKPADETTEQELTNVLNTHVVGAHALTREIGRRMMERKKGNILFIASMASIFGIPQVIAYSAAKTGIIGLMRTLAVEWSPHGIRVNAIAPGWIKTDMSATALDNDPERKNKILGRTPMGTLGAIDDVANAAQFLCSPAAGFITGVCLPVDGGISMGF